MPKDKDLKKRVRARMLKTGESYTAARARLVAKRERERSGAAAAASSTVSLAERAGMSDAAVRAKTGRDWRGWTAVLDAADAASWSHRDIARYLVDEYELGGWWAQSVTVGYERIRGLRDKNQRRDGSYDVNKSKTLPVPVEALYEAFLAPGRRRWLDDEGVRVKTASRNVSMRLTWSDGCPVDVYFWAKGPRKSQVQLQHRGLASRENVERVRVDWTRRIAALAEALAR